MSSLHTISEHEEHEESLEPVSGVQHKHLVTLTLKELQAHKRLTTGRTAQHPMSKSPPDPNPDLIQAGPPVRHTSKVNLPQWLENLMRDIEEATTHELTVE